MASELPSYSAKHWQVQDGLPHNAVYALLQTEDHYLWIGTQDGLARFDGQKFSAFAPPEKGAAPMPVRTLAQTRDGTCYVGFDAGIRSFASRSSLRNAPNLSGIHKLFASADGALWIGSTNGLTEWREGKARTWTTADGLSDNTVLSICADPAGGLWLGTAAGLSRWHNGEVKRRFIPGLSSLAIRAVWMDRAGALWIGQGSGLSRLKDGQLTQYSKNEGLPDNFVRLIFEDSRGQLWVGTMSGLCRRQGEKFVAENSAEGGSYETVFCLMEDHEGSLWLGTKEGLTQLQLKPFRSYTRQQGLPHNNIMSVREDRSGTLWAASWGGGLNRLRDGELVTYNFASHRLHDVLLSLCESRDGSMWVGADFYNGIYQWRDDVFTSFGKERGFVGPAARVLHEDRAGNLWVGTSGGLHLWQGEKFQHFTKANGLAGDVVRAIYEDTQGHLWIGTSGGLSRLVNDQDQTTNRFVSFAARDGFPTNAVTAFYEDKPGQLWIGTDGGGLVRLKFDSPAASSFQLQTFTTQQGLFSDSIFEIVEDDHGYFWMSCFSGVFRVKKEALQLLEDKAVPQVSGASFGRDDGMSSAQCNGVAKPAAWKGKDGRIWFPTTRGVVVVDPKLIRENDAPPTVAIEQVVADKQQVTRSPSQPVVISPGRGELEFHYTALSFRFPEKNRFKFKLEGVDPDWVEAGPRRAAYYNNLKPGDYTFRVIGCNHEGVWNETGALVKLSLQPHFWQTTWFITLLGLSAMGLVAGIVRYVTWRRLRQRLERLEQQHIIEKERVRIAADLHDQLGASLTRVGVLTELAARDADQPEAVRLHTRQGEKTIRAIGKTLHEIVWAVNPQNDTLPRLAAFIAHYAEEFFENTDVRCRLDLPADLPEMPLSAETRHNVFLVVKEALNNIAKHAEAREVKIGFRKTKTGVEVFVSDDGKGFLPEQADATRHGLQNMQQRMADVGGRCELNSQPGAGTRLRLEIPRKDF